jgi:hypothetical protein
MRVEEKNDKIEPSQPTNKLQLVRIFQNRFSRFFLLLPEFCTTMLISDSVLIATAWDLLPCCRMQRILCTAAA